MVNKIKQYYYNTVDKVKTSVRIDKEAPFFYISLILIVTLAIIVRMSPVIHGTFLIKAFDPHYQFDSFKQLLDMGFMTGSIFTIINSGIRRGLIVSISDQGCSLLPLPYTSS